MAFTEVVAVRKKIRASGKMEDGFKTTLEDFDVGAMAAKATGSSFRTRASVEDTSLVDKTIRPRLLYLTGAKLDSPRGQPCC